MNNLCENKDSLVYLLYKYLSSIYVPDPGDITVKKFLPYEAYLLEDKIDNKQTDV